MSDTDVGAGAPRFTPGPWRAVRGDALVLFTAVNIAHIGVTDGDAYNAPFVVQARPGSKGSLPHNALLIAASPDLYEALEAMRAEFRAADLPYGSKAYLQSGAALAKARGEA